MTFLPYSPNPRISGSQIPVMPVTHYSCLSCLACSSFSCLQTPPKPPQFLSLLNDHLSVSCPGPPLNPKPGLLSTCQRTSNIRGTQTSQAIKMNPPPCLKLTSLLPA